MPSAGSEPTISASEWPRADTLDRTANGTVQSTFCNSLCGVPTGLYLT